jgi:hypothetical protein
MSDRSGTFEVWTSALDGSNQRQLSSGGGYDPRFLPDGDVAYRTPDANAVKGLKVPVGGGSPTPLFADASQLPTNFEFHELSPDGRLALGHYLDREARGLRTAIVPLDNPAAVTRLPFTTDNLRWSRDGQAVEDTVVRGGVANIVRIPIDGSSPAPVTKFTSDLIFQYAWSLDGKRLAMARGTATADVVLATSEDRGRQ